jgi:molybdate transport system ATP-binding protein
MLEFAFDYRRGDFTLDAGATAGAGVTGIFGPSGSGKSTLLALICGLLRPQRGTLRIDGEVLVDTGARVFVPAWRRHVGIVFQDGQLFPHLSVRRNLRYGHDRLPPAQRRYGFDAVVELLEIGGLLERRPALLSGGERQRVALGRALLYSPRVLLLDEPLSSLDDRLKQQILPFLRRIKEETGVPMLYVSHSRAEIDYLADTVLSMQDGTLSPEA